MFHAPLVTGVGGGDAHQAGPQVGGLPTAVGGHQSLKVGSLQAASDLTVTCRKK